MDCNGFLKEVIYVDSSSLDSSVAIAEAYGVRVMKLSSSPTAGKGRNMGWRAGTGSFVLFLDGDTVLAPYFVSKTLPIFDCPEVAVVWGHRRETFPGRSLYNGVLDLEWVYPPGETDFCGGDALIRRTALEASGGYDETLIAGEEPEMCRRIRALGMRIIHVDEEMTGHDLAITRFYQYWKHAVRAGHAFAEISSRFAGTSDPLWLAESSANRRKAILIVVTTCVGLATSLLAGSVLPAVVCLSAFGLLVVRTAWKSRWKSRDVTMLMLYGVHSHFQQIPIFLGQMRFLLKRKDGRPKKLIEYKFD